MSNPETSARGHIIDGKKHARAVRDEVRDAVAKLVAAGHAPPGLGVLLVGDHPASLAYVRAKTAACQEAGFHSEQHNLPATAKEKDVLSWVRSFNDNPRIHGMLVQLPLPEQIRPAAILDTISPAKDVDGLTPESAGLLATGRPRFIPCTPLGVREMLMRENIETRGRHVVIIGRSSLVGRPLAALLSLRGDGGDATVTLTHSQTRDLAKIARTADILVAAIGRARTVGITMVREGAVVVDVGINRLPDGSLAGDVDFEAVRARAAAITPVPGGVGPMTIAMLLRNTLDAASATKR